MQSTFLSSLKEADNFKHCGEVVQNLTKDQHVKLWHGIKTNNYEGLALFSIKKIQTLYIFNYKQKGIKVLD